MSALRFGLRAKLVIAVVVIQGLMLTFLVKSSLYAMESGLSIHIHSQVDELRPLLNAALASSIAAQDIGRIDDILRAVQMHSRFRYLRLTDASGRLLANTGIPAGVSLPELDTDPQSISDGVFDTEIPIEASGQKLGTLRYGLDVSGLILRQGLLDATLMVLVSTLLIMLAAVWLSRRLHQLASASRAIAEGHYDMGGIPAGSDEVGELAQALTYMSSALRRQIEDADREHARLAALIGTMKLGILFVGPDARVVYHNPAFDRIWQVGKLGALQGKPVRDIFGLSPCHLERPEEFDAHLSETLSSNKSNEMLEIEIRDGRLVTQQGYPVEGRDKSIIGHLFVYEDVTRERQAALQLVALAEHDSLTGLHNRHRFQQELVRTVDDAFRSRSHCALLFFDLDEFKAINDHFGHGAGDALLIRVGNEVSRIVRRHESLFRLGGDEFAIVLPNADLNQAGMLAGRVVSAISGITLSFEGKNLRISSSLGIAVYPDQAHDAEQLVAYADAAMYQAKQAGKNTWRVYSADMDATPETLHRLTWNERLAAALANDRFILQFQGVHDAGTGEIHHLEALLRLNDEPGKEPVTPSQFIPVAEKSQRIVDIDRWVLRRAVGLLAANPAAPAIAVNLSGRSFDDPRMPDYIAGLLHTHNVSPYRLLIEITETAAVSDLTDAQRFIDAIRTTGCRVYLDDFGAGYASFAYLKHLAVDAIKIDGMFIRNLTDDHENQVLVRGMVEVARGLDKITVAECVEDERVLKLLADMGVTLVQGYYLDQPRANHPALAEAQV
jgi:diguanylate cyclase (GGDEF)-like protein